MKRIKYNIFFLLLCFIATSLQANAKRKSIFFTLPTHAVEGLLPNGLRYILMHNEQPVHCVEMRLVMHTGSLVEENNQKGCAHFLEHLSFEGTKHFPKRSLVNAFEQQGMKYGRDINAFTGFDRTVYSLSLPFVNAQQQTKILSLSLRAAADWLGNIVFNDTKIRHEKGVILEELRSYMLPDNFYSLKIGHGRYAHRMPLGSADDICNVTLSTLQQYYSKWYLPQNATLIMVGDMDVQEVQRLIAETFDVKSVNKRATSIPNYPLIYNKGVAWSQIVDSLQTANKVELIVPHTVKFTATLDDKVQRERTKLLLTLLENRCRVLNLCCDVYDNWYLSNTNHFVFSFSQADKCKLLCDIEALSAECQRIIQQGICLPELNHLIANQLQKIVAENIDKVSSEFCEDFIDYTLYNDRQIYTSSQAEKVKVLLAQTQSKDVVKLLKQILKSMRQSLLIACTSNATTHLSQQEVMQAWHKGKHLSLGTYNFQAIKPATQAQRMQCPILLRGSKKYNIEVVKQRIEYSSIGVTKVLLSNGLRILLKPTPRSDNMMYMALLGRGGMADITPQQQKRYHEAFGYVDMGGLQRISADSLSAIMIQDSLSMAVGIDEYWHQLLASCPVSKCGELTNLVYEKIIHPALDRSTFNDMRQDEIKSFGKETLLQRMMKRDVDRMIDACIDSLLQNGIYARHTMTLSDWQQLNLDTLAQYYKQTFADMQHTTLIVTGNFSLKSVLPLLVDVFAHMPQQAQPTLHPRTLIVPDKEVREVFTDDEMGNKATLNIVLPLRYEPSLQSSLTLKLIRDLIQEQLINVLREQQHIVYSPYADLYYDGYPQQRAYFRITIDMAKDNLQKVENMVNSILAQLGKKPVNKDDLDKMKQSFMVTKQQALSDATPVEWKNALISLVKNGESIADFAHYNERLQQITPEDVRKMFAEKINLKHKIILVKQQ